MMSPNQECPQGDQGALELSMGQTRVDCGRSPIAKLSFGINNS